MRILIEIVEHMTAEELRNYLMHTEALLESTERLLYANSDLSRAWKDVVNRSEFARDCEDCRNEEMFRIREVETDLYQKYEQYVPRPMCEAKVVDEKN